MDVISSSIFQLCCPLHFVMTLEPHDHYRPDLSNSKMKDIGSFTNLFPATNNIRSVPFFTVGRRRVGRRVVRVRASVVG